MMYVRYEQANTDPPIEPEDLFDRLNRIILPRTRDILVVVDDQTRPKNIAGRILVERAIKEVGPEKVTVLVACGMHREPTRNELVEHLGEVVVSNVRIYTHNSHYSTSKYFAGQFQHKFVIACGCIMPHTFTGISGWGKLICPGLAKLDQTISFHNSTREQVEEIWSNALSGVDVLVNTTVNIYGDITDIYVGTGKGEAYQIFRRQAQFAYAKCLSSILPDVAILTPTIKNNDFLQAMNAFKVCEKKPIAKEQGEYCLDLSLVLDGIGVHRIFQQFNGVKPAKYDDVWLHIFGDRHIAFITNKIPTAAIQDYFNSQVTVYPSQAAYINHCENCDYSIVNYIGADLMIGV